MNDKRQTDSRLLELCDKFDKHIKRFESHERIEESKMAQMIDAQLHSTLAVTALTQSVNKLTEDTRDIVQLNKDIQGATRIGRGLQNFMIYVTKWGVVGTGVIVAIKWTTDKFS